MVRFLKEHPEIDLKVSTSAKTVDFDRDDFDLAVRYGRGVYPGLHAELCLPVEVFPVCSPALRKGEHPLREPADLKHHTLLHDDSVYTESSDPDWAMWLRHAGVEGVDPRRLAGMLREARIEMSEGARVALARSQGPGPALQPGRGGAGQGDGLSSVRHHESLLARCASPGRAGRPTSEARPCAQAHPTGISFLRPAR